MNCRTMCLSLALAAAAGVAAAQSSAVRVQLSGYQEVPAVSSAASGELRLRIHAGGAIEYELSYAGLEGTVTQAHIHFGQPGVNGGISAWLCGTATNPGPAGTPTCPGPDSGTVSGTLTAADVVGPAAQGIEPGNLDELLDAIRAGVTYANVHSTKWPGGELRSRLGAGASGGHAH